MDNLAQGGCLCGAVRFRISGRFEGFFLCHCSRCRKDSGSAHSANLFASGAQILWLSGQDRVKTFRLPGTRHVKCFCTECGSALPFAQAEDGLVVVPAGALEGALGFRPSAHICHASRADWDEDLGALEQIAGLPG
ncbi:GFA family protein [Phaeovulum vinaykumarii]|uniref:Uncharacterized conserved protein n=1 Tax=Phaeovulum vinaykumarii TaxID=407234 RepID=A0A1N7JNT1_9RHOB|nr:GFA family protein [Phaeovulum vinaykumarii]SIS50975.1 Uncharacterized conserved protein [Phaeovulum vinaykumarii]SOB90518.1 hypothetical protein SAMN05878426_101199 [Phaeovulum vinaykumarii]